MKIVNCKLKIFSFLVLVFFIVCCFAFAAEVDPQAVVDRRQKLESELAALEQLIESQREIIRGKQTEATTLERDLAILNAQIEKIRLEIRARNLAISQLNDNIDKHSVLIGELGDKIESEKNSLAEFMRRINEMDEVSLVELVLGYNNFSDFFEDFSALESIQKQIGVYLEEIRNTQDKTKVEKQALEEEKLEEMELRNIQEIEKKRAEQKETEKKKILKTTKGEEEKYQKVLKQNEKSAAAIRSELFLLQGSPAIPFEKAVEYANFAFNTTGVRPAFLLGVISYESELGANLGSGNYITDLYNCYIKIGYKTSAEKQKAAFLQITSELGLDPGKMPVSKAPRYGCGGAMGPAQFMPTTWQLYKDRISQLTQHSPPSPWDPKDAFVAAALFLKDNGAAAGGYTAERTAALKYFAGSNYKKAAYAFYGDDVMVLTAKYQNQIDIISR